MESLLKSKFLFCSIFILILISFPIFASDVNSVYIREILLLVLFIFIALVLIISIFYFSSYLKDKLMIKKQINSITSENYNFLNDDTNKTRNKKIKFGLTTKLMMVTVSLVILVIILISLPLSFIILNNQEETLASGLQRRITVLMDSITNGTKVYLPTQNTLELYLLTEQSDTLPEAQNVTILSFPEDEENKYIDYVWASNDENIVNKIDTLELIQGKSRITSAEIQEIAEKTLKLNQKIKDKVKKNSDQIIELISEYRKIPSDENPENIEKKENLFALIKELNTKLNFELHQFALENAGAIPQYNNKNIDRQNAKYLFYQPIIFSEKINDDFVKGLILIEANTENLIQSLNITQKKVFVSTLILSGIVILIGTIVSLILSFYIVKPIKKLHEHVNMIKETENKVELFDRKIFINTKDEIEILSTNINEMTENLALAAGYESMLLGGKEVQRAFLPLDTIDDVNKIKLSVGHIETDNIQFFGYYEGAKGVSGDFFDFKNLDERYFALIKCDVSGKGAPAALIMAEVSALFCDYFSEWSYEKNGINLQKLVYKINNHLESRNLKGKFAAFTLGIFDTEQGDIYFCNAGDNVIHIFDYSENKQKKITLPSTPAAGTFSSSIIEQNGGFPTVKVHLDKNDVLFLYTDGIEESKRFFRNHENEIIKFIPNSNKILEDKTDTNGISSEEFGKERIKKIIKAVFAKEKYLLEKKANPIENKNLNLIFDFSTLEGTPEDVIMALVCVEKIFRLYQTSSKFDHGLVDKKIDKFLEQHFNKYDTICNAKTEHPNPDLRNEYIIYTSIKEEEQTDDLTLVAIKKK